MNQIVKLLKIKVSKSFKFLEISNVPLMKMKIRIFNNPKFRNHSWPPKYSLLHLSYCKKVKKIYLNNINLLHLIIMLIKILIKTFKHAWKKHNLKSQRENHIRPKNAKRQNKMIGVKAAEQLNKKTDAKL